MKWMKMAFLERCPLPNDSHNAPGSKDQSNTVVALPKLLAILQAGMQAEVKDLSYDYLALHRSCWTLFRAIRGRCGDQLIRMFGPNYIEKEYLLQFIVAYVLMSAIVTGEVLAEAAGVIDDMVERGEGRVVGTILKDKLKLDFEFEED